MNVAPSATFENTFAPAETGLVGTIAFGIYDGDTAIQALATTAINEIGTTGAYIATRTAPGTAGQYVLIWSLDGSLDPDQIFIEDLLVTSEEGAAIGGTSNLYVTADELKEILQLTGETFADSAIDIAVSAASRACDAYKKKRGTGFYPTAGTRYYSPGVYDLEAPIDDLVSLTSVTIDADGDGSYDTTWVNGTDFYLGPVNAAADGRPYKRIVLRPQAARTFPPYINGVKVIGTFGWAETPIEVKQAAILIANHLLYRTREAPLGVLVAAGAEAVAMARLGRIDAAAALLLDQIDPSPATRSLQLR